MVEAYTMTPQVALHIKALDNFTDQFGIKRSVSLSPLSGCGFRGVAPVYRHIGDEWLVTSEQCESYIPDVTEVGTHTHHNTITEAHPHALTPSQEMQRVVNLTVLKSHQYAVVLEPIGDDNKNRLGCRELRIGPKTFFLHPGTQATSDYTTLHHL